MQIKCGEYKHFKGKRYIAYGMAVDHQNNEFVLYQQQYGNNAFWIRPIPMFTEEIENNGKIIPRFKLLKKTSEETAITDLTNILKTQSITILHSETEEAYKIFSINTNSKEIILTLYELFSSYLTDTQIAWRIGYDFYKIDEKKYIHSTIRNIPAKKKLVIDDKSELDKEYKDKETIKSLNPCSVDLHISDHFFSKAKPKTIDIASMMHFSTKASELWKEIHPKKINGFDSIALKPGQTIITHTLERIQLPSDCAGKIEIKSTYARLALTITASDFCNPGWEGYFPLTITNHGKHKIILHPKEKMLQLILIQTDGQIINEYPQQSTYMNDDGTPFKFWHAQTVKHLQKQRYSYEILEFYQKVLNSINSDNCANPDEAKKRFEDTFLLFCERKLNNKKYNTIHNPKELLKKIWNKYKRKESISKILMSKLFKVLAFFITFIPTIVVACVELITKNEISSSILILLGASLILAVGIEIVLHILTPACFCTFEKIEFENTYKKKQ